MKTYYLTPSFKRYYLAMGLPVSAAIVAIFIYVLGNLICFILYVPFIIIGMIRTHYWLTNESISISENEIRYKTSGLTIQTEWKNIEEIKKVFIYVFGSKQECLIVDQARIKIISTSLLGSFLSPLTGWNLQKAIIPLTHFSSNWRDSELGQQIKEYAPHLFQEENKTPA